MKSIADGRTTGKTIALAVVGLAALLAVWVVYDLDTAPRTDDAYAYADTISVVPEVSGRIIDLPLRDNQNVKKGLIRFLRG